ncbi:EamA family transporter RarD [Planococcus shenhongbingii]|uniref:EamA family transporter RarD n=1 Tax=Planococcus shenhongbingii TaxID=3058398 RepID=A0ABT8NDP5_9BACL|nr:MULTISPECIES: EamA family transporter RarD [unclassified Planococcus (in: firmicutes)]MDN7246013.1 EamA family transporter RarD [Planococcus sp. N017]WKA59857.1 EamA family transporter RarD [Planococcus sp. N016]
MAAEKKGILYTILTYAIWGILPLYWKQVDHVPSDEILTSRILWAFVLTVLFIIVINGGKQLIADLKSLWQSKKTFFTLMLASYLITANWFLYIFAVTNDRIVETSMGYYINPLVSMLLGVFFLKEKLSPAIKVAFVLAAIGVSILAISYGTLPWLAFGMALSFAFYGLIKKTIKLDALRGLALETLFVLPLAIIYYIYLFSTSQASFLNEGASTDILLIISGAATALPLVLFATGAPLIPMYMIGFLQYIAPTLMLLLGVLVYGESFNRISAISFSFIWVALIIFTTSKVLEARGIKKEKLNAQH